MPRPSLPVVGADSQGAWGTKNNALWVDAHASLDALTPLTGIVGGYALVATSYSGVDPTGATDSAVGLTTWMNAMSTQRRSGILPPGTYRLIQRIFVPSNVHFTAYGAKIEGYQADVSGGPTSMLNLWNVTDISIQGLELDGKKASYATATEQRHNILCYGATWVTLEDIYTHDAKGDGFVAGKGASGQSAHLYAYRSRFDANHRQGMSLTAALHCGFEDCAFTNTSGTPPACGVDLETDLADDLMYDIHFLRCLFDGNAGSGFLAAGRSARTVEQASYTLTDCRITNNAEPNGGLVSWDADYATIRRTHIANNAGRGIYIVGTTKRTLIDDCTVTGNAGDAAIKVRQIVGTTHHVIVRHSDVLANNSTYAVWFHADTAIRRAEISGSRLGDNSAQVGFVWTSGGNITSLLVADTEFRGLAAGVPIDFTGTPASLILRGNAGQFVTQNSGTATVGDGGVIAHGLYPWIGPRRWGVTGSVAGQIVTATANGTNLTVAIKTGGGAAGSSQTVAWWAES